MVVFSVIALLQGKKNLVLNQEHVFECFGSVKEATRMKTSRQIREDHGGQQQKIRRVSDAIARGIDDGGHATFG
ncbi:MAG: hypothetical protein VX190_03740, partial [Bacteroidota bacterium]|nr:hypothetical protein [Bacteroidota bacterium]